MLGNGLEIKIGNGIFLSMNEFEKVLKEHSRSLVHTFYRKTWNFLTNNYLWKSFSRRKKTKKDIKSDRNSTGLLIKTVMFLQK
jgi:hypothetical protein